MIKEMKDRIEWIMSYAHHSVLKDGEYTVQVRSPNGTWYSRTHTEWNVAVDLLREDIDNE